MNHLQRFLAHMEYDPADRAPNGIRDYVAAGEQW